MKNNCSYCNGTGNCPWNPANMCPVCNGSGHSRAFGYLKKFIIWISIMASNGAFAEAWAFELSKEAPTGQCRRVTELEFTGQERVMRALGYKVEKSTGQCGTMLLVNDGVWIVTETAKECQCIMFWYRSKIGVK